MKIFLMFRDQEKEVRWYQIWRFYGHRHKKAYLRCRWRNNMHWVLKFLLLSKRIIGRKYRIGNFQANILLFCGFWQNGQNILKISLKDLNKNSENEFIPSKILATKLLVSMMVKISITGLRAYRSSLQIWKKLTSRSRQNLDSCLNSAMEK